MAPQIHKPTMDGSRLDFESLSLGCRPGIRHTLSKSAMLKGEKCRNERKTKTAQWRQVDLQAQFKTPRLAPPWSSWGCDETGPVASPHEPRPWRRTTRSAPLTIGTAEKIRAPAICYARSIWRLRRASGDGNPHA